MQVRLDDVKDGEKRFRQTTLGAYLSMLGSFVLIISSYSMTLYECLPVRSCHLSGLCPDAVGGASEQWVRLVSVGTTQIEWENDR